MFVLKPQSTLLTHIGIFIIRLLVFVIIDFYVPWEGLLMSVLVMILLTTIYIIFNLLVFSHRFYLYIISFKEIIVITITIFLVLLINQLIIGFFHYHYRFAIISFHYDSYFFSCTTFGMWMPFHKGGIGMESPIPQFYFIFLLEQFCFSLLFYYVYL